MTTLVMTMKRVLIFLGLVLIHASVQAANITVKSDRNPVRMNESFTLTFTANGSVDDDPDFRPLEKAFDILRRSSGSNTTIINGSFSSTKTWTLNLMPKQEGSITIPAIAFGSDQSPAMLLAVKAADNNTANSGSEMFLEMVTPTQKTWVQSEIVLTVRLLTAVNLSQVGLGQLKIPGRDTEVKPLGDDSQYQTQRGGRTYLVVERKYALFPQQSGTLHIPAQVAEVSIPSGRNTFFDPFARNGQTRRLRSKPLDIQILPIPDAFKGKQWLAARNVQLTEAWSPNPPVFKVGEPVTRSVILVADGATAAQLPALQKYSLAGVKLYPDQPALKDEQPTDGITGSRVEKVALMPTQPGKFTLPEIRIPWWNSDTGKMEIARLASKTVQVLPGGSTSGTPAVANPTPAAMPGSAQNTPTEDNETPTPRPEIVSPTTVWPWISLALATAWLLTLLLWWWTRRHSPPAPASQSASTTKPVSARQLQSPVLKACKDHQAQACKNALIAWGRARYPNASINSLADLAERVAEPLKDPLLQLNACLYGSNASDWSGDTMAQAFTAALSAQPPAKPASRPGLQPLNPAV